MILTNVTLPSVSVCQPKMIRPKLSASLASKASNTFSNEAFLKLQIRNRCRSCQSLLNHIRRGVVQEIYINFIRNYTRREMFTSKSVLVASKAMYWGNDNYISVFFFPPVLALRTSVASVCSSCRTHRFIVNLTWSLQLTCARSFGTICNHVFIWWDKTKWHNCKTFKAMVKTYWFIRRNNTYNAYLEYQGDCTWHDRKYRPKHSWK